MKEILTKTVSLTVKDLLIGTGVVAGASTLTGICIGLKNRSNKVKKLKEEKKILEDKYVEQGNELASYIDKLKCEIGQNRLNKWSKDIPNKADIEKIVVKSNLDTEDKVIIIDKYTKLINSFFSINSKYAFDFPDWCDKLVKKIMSMADDILLGDNKSLEVLATVIKKQKEEEAEADKLRREEKEVKAQREHELKLKEKDKEYLQTYLDSVENMKEIEATTAKTKTMAFAEVAKSAINNIGKKKEEE